MKVYCGLLPRYLAPYLPMLRLSSTLGMIISVELRRKVLLTPRLLSRRTSLYKSCSSTVFTVSTGRSTATLNDNTEDALVVFRALLFSVVSVSHEFPALLCSMALFALKRPWCTGCLLKVCTDGGVKIRKGFDGVSSSSPSEIFEGNVPFGGCWRSMVAANGDLAKIVSTAAMGDIVVFC